MIVGSYFLLAGIPYPRYAVFAIMGCLFTFVGIGRERGFGGESDTELYI